jgi:hypothetical protein
MESLASRSSFRYLYGFSFLTGVYHYAYISCYLDGFFNFLWFGLSCASCRAVIWVGGLDFFTWSSVL